MIYRFRQSKSYLDIKRNKRCSESFPVLRLSSSFLSVSGASVCRAGRKAEKGLCCSLSLCPSEETLLFFPSCCSACDGQHSGFGWACGVGCSLWARTQRGVEARAPSQSSKVARDDDPSDPVVRASEETTCFFTSELLSNFLHHPHCFLSIRISLSVFAFLCAACKWYPSHFLCPVFFV